MSAAQYTVFHLPREVEMQDNIILWLWAAESYLQTAGGDIKPKIQNTH